jgi:lysophospholipase L1-like esterase
MLTDITALEQYFKLSVDIKNKILTNDVNTFKNFSSFVRFNQLSPTYYSHDGHYSSKGYKLLADLVLCKLQEMSVL